jgi:alpha/beta superfamily hydrolase
MSEPVIIPGTRDVRASLTDPDASACVVACPPHPNMGGTRSDNRLTAVSDTLEREGIASLRLDYGEWDEGQGERTDVLNTIEWATERYDAVELYGFSFGGTIALIAATETDTDLSCVSALAPTARITSSDSDSDSNANSGGLDAVDALSAIACPVQIVYAERDSTADWEPVVEKARQLDYAVESMSADHFFLGQTEKVADEVAGFLVDRL